MLKIRSMCTGDADLALRPSLNDRRAAMDGTRARQSSRAADEDDYEDYDVDLGGKRKKVGLQFLISWFPFMARKLSGVVYTVCLMHPR